MNLLWVGPAAVAAIGLAGVAGLARRASLEAAALQRELRGFGEHRLAMVEVRDSSQDALAAARALRRRAGE
jgi:hypothetical protein